MPHQRWITFTRIAAVAGLAVFAVGTFATEPGDFSFRFFDPWLYDLLMVFACVVVGSRAYLVERDRAAWTAFTAGLVCWTFGELWYAAMKPESYPSAADVGFIAFYPLVYAGMVLLIRSRARSIGGTLWLDGLTASLAAGAVAAAILVQLVLQSTEGPRATVVTNLAYPVGDVLLLSAVFGVFSLSRWRPGRIWLLLGFGVTSTALADAAYLFQSSHGTYVGGTWIDILWPAAMLLIASAAWAGDGKREDLAVEGRPLLAVPAACAVAAIGILLYDHFHRLNLLALALSAATLLLVVVRLGLTFRENRRLYELTHAESITDALTGLGNRRKLLWDLDRRLVGEHTPPTLLMIFDLDGFKSYNDTFGHPAGDALLARLGAKLAEVPGVNGDSYRLGGDEFCVIATIADGEAEKLIDRACAALTESGEGFHVTTSFGAVLLPEEAGDASRALHVADERLYAQKHARRLETDRMMDALLEALSLRQPDLPVHLDNVGSLAVDIAHSLELPRAEIDELVRAAQLHDLGKLAVPDEILHKAGPLDDREWAFIRQHPLVGERILRASPALKRVAAIVRSTHERWDGAGYPDGLAGQEIPIASRIIAACDAFTAMTSPRPYRVALSEPEALDELDRVSGTQFDPTVVQLLASHVRARLAAEQPA